MFGVIALQNLYGHAPHVDGSTGRTLIATCLHPADPANEQIADGGRVHFWDTSIFAVESGGCDNSAL